MYFKENIINFQALIKTGYLRKFINRNLRINIINSLFSSILRIFFKFRLVFQFYWFLKSSVDYKTFNQFFSVYIGFFVKRKYFSLINLDRHLVNNPFCCSNLKNLPFNKESCQMIHVKHFFEYFRKYNLNSLIRSWKKKLIPGGILQIQFKLKNNEEKYERLKITLAKNEFLIKELNKSGLKIDDTLKIITVKERAPNKLIHSISNKKIQDIILVVKQNKEILSNNKNLCILGHRSKDIKQFIDNNNFNVNIQSFENLTLLKNKINNYFDIAIVFNYFEFNNYSQNSIIFNELRRILKTNGKILVIIPEHNNYATKDSAQFFDKGIFTRILDENNVDFEWINVSSTFRLIQALIINRNSYPEIKNNTKILLLGVYSLRYTFLSNARWDSQARAFGKLGYNTLILDIKENSFYYLIKTIEAFKPDILWVAGKRAYLFLKKYADFFRTSKIKVVYWMWDITYFDTFNFKEVVDYMFITSKGQIPLYKKKFNLDNVYYMPASIMPEIIHRNKFIEEEFDVGFSGQLSYLHPWYKERTEMLDLIKKHFKVKIFLRIYNNIPEYYAKCKIVFGGTPYFKDLELYASNRPFIAFSSGCCFLTNYFKGLEKIAKNEKHLLWYNNKDDLIILLNKYINNKSLREEIKKNAENLGREKHNYINRITNMLDIINGKTKDFYGFIN